MKSLLLSIGLAALCTGCVSTVGSRTLPDGSVLQLRSTRWFWASEGIDVSTHDTNGFVFNLRVSKSNASAEALGAVAEGIAKGMVKGAKPIP